MSQRAIEEGVSNFNSSGLIVLELFSDLAPPLIGPDPLRVDGRIAGVDTRGAAVDLAIGKTVILLHPPLPSVGVSIEINRGCHQDDSLADG